MLDRASPGQDGLVERARALAPLIASAAGRIEQEGRIPAGVLDAMHEARIFRMLIPRSIGGDEVEPATFFRVIEAIAQTDASVAWCVSQGSGGAMAAAYLAPEIAREVFGDARAVLASGAPGGPQKAVAADGGYRVSGRWRYASGSRHATWIGAHCIVHERDGALRLGPDGKPMDQRTVLFPKSKATMIDVWQVMGLRGTGSDDYEINDLFVPEAYSFMRESDADRRERGPLYRFSIFNMFGMGFSAVALGIARAMLDDFIRLATEKTAQYSTLRLRDNHLVQGQVGLSQTRIEAARTYVLDAYDRLYAAAARGETFSQAQRFATRGVTCYAIQQAREVADFCYHAAGGTAIFESNPFERRFRDMHTVTQQSQAHVTNFEHLGQSLMGLTPSRKL